MPRTLPSRAGAPQRWLLLGAAAFAVTIAIAWFIRPQGIDAPFEQPATPRAAGPAAASPTPVDATTPDGQAAPVPAGPGLVGDAEGSIQIAGSADAAPVALRPRHAVGVWLPGQNRLRIGLVAEEPGHVGANHLLDALSAVDALTRDDAPAAVLEFVFMPTAQAFTSDELEQATLTVRDGRGRLATTDVLGSLQWSGSVPSPQLGAAAYRTIRIDMKLEGSGYPTANGGGRNDWALAFSAPVGMRQ